MLFTLRPVLASSNRKLHLQPDSVKTQEPFNYINIKHSHKTCDPATYGAGLHTHILPIFKVRDVRTTCVM